MLCVFTGSGGPSHKARVGHHEWPVGGATGRYGKRRRRSRSHVTQLKTITGHLTASDHVVIVGGQGLRSAGLTATERCSMNLLEPSAAFVRSIMLVTLLNIFIEHCICLRHSVHYHSVHYHSVHYHSVPCSDRERVNDDRRNGTKVLSPQMLQCRPAKCVQKRLSNECPVLSLSLDMFVAHYCCSLLRFGEIFIPTLYDHNKHSSAFTTQVR